MKPFLINNVDMTHSNKRGLIFMTDCSQATHICVYSVRTSILGFSQRT